MSWVKRKVGSVELTIGLSEVVGKQRPRFNTRTGSTYTPPKTKRAEGIVKKAFARVAGDEWSCFEGEVHLRVTTWRALAKTNPKFWAGRADLSVPDWDNTGKLVSDALNKLAYADDSQITLCTVRKMPRLLFVAGDHVRIQIDYYEESYSKEKK